MRLDFNVLWVDDQPDSVMAQIEAIERQMREQGFAINPTLCSKIEDVHVQLANDVFNDEVDMILVDWDLGEGAKGQDAIAEVRQRIPYKDVVFYSANTDVNALKELVFKSGLEGVYCAPRSELVEEVMGVFDSLVKKVLDLDHTRGIVMGATSDIDFIVGDCLSAIHERLDERGQQKMIADAIARVDGKISNITETATKLKQAPEISAILRSHLVFTANDGLRMLSKALKGQAFDTLEEHRSAVVTYINDVVPHRNKLGHQVLSPEGRPIAIAGSDGDQIDVEQMRDLRRLLLQLRDTFRDLQSKLRTTP